MNSWNRSTSYANDVKVPNLDTNLFHCMKERTMATIRELGFCNLNSRADFMAIKRFFQHEQFDDRFLAEEMEMTEILFPPPAAEELQAIRQRITKDYDVRRAAMQRRMTLKSLVLPVI